MTRSQRKTLPSMRLHGLLALVCLALGAGACSSFSYFDLDLKFGTGFDFVKISTIDSCQLLVTGAANDDIVLPAAQCRASTSGEFGTVEYSTLADSGNITFTLTASAFPSNNPNCKLGDGSTTVEAGKAVRKTATVTAVAMSQPGPCQ